MIVNEIAQWAVLAFLSVFVLGLTRQLGNFLVSRQELVAADSGPPLGGELPSEILAAAERQQVASLLSDRGSRLRRFSWSTRTARAVTSCSSRLKKAECPTGCRLSSSPGKQGLSTHGG